MPSSASSAPAPERSVEQIEADIARTREELAETLGVLADKVNPKLQAARAAENAKITASSLATRARAAAESASTAAQRFAGDVAKGRPKAVTLAAVVAGLATGAIVLAGRRRG